MCVSVCVSARTFNVVCLHLWVSLPPFPSFVWLSHLPAPHHLISNFSSHSSPNNSVCCAGSLLPYTFLHAKQFLLCAWITCVCLLATLLIYYLVLSCQPTLPWQTQCLVSPKPCLQPTLDSIPATFLSNTCFQ